MNRDIIYYASATDKHVGGIMFSVHPSVSTCVRAFVRALLLLARYLTNHWKEFHQTLTVDVGEGTDELVRF